MRYAILTGTILASLLVTGCGREETVELPIPEMPPAARAELRNADGELKGNAIFTETAAGVRVQVQVSGLEPGVRGIHIHEAGKCDPPDFVSAGAHFNPAARLHGRLHPQGHHAGDLGNITIAGDGTGTIDQTFTGITLGEGDHSLFHPGGTSMIVHAEPDDEKTDPTGGAGARVLCGVITRD